MSERTDKQTNERMNEKYAGESNFRNSLKFCVEGLGPLLSLFRLCVSTMDLLDLKTICGLKHLINLF